MKNFFRSFTLAVVVPLLCCSQAFAFGLWGDADLGLARKNGSRIVYTLRSALNASNAQPRTALTGTALTQTATSSVVIPNSTGTLITIAGGTPGNPAIPGAVYSGGNWSAPEGATSALVDGLTQYSGVANSPGGGLGILNRPAFTNKVTSFKYLPSAATNATIAGGGSTPAVLSLATDAGSIAAATTAGIRTLCSGNFFKVDNSAGDAVATLTFAGTTANTNKHSFSLWVYRAAGTGTTKVMLTSGTGAQTISGTAFTKYSADNQTPSGTTQNLVMEVGIGDTVYCILPCLIEYAQAQLWPLVAFPDAASAVTTAVRHLSTLKGAELGSQIKLSMASNEALSSAAGRTTTLLSDATRKLKYENGTGTPGLLVFRDESQVAGVELTDVTGTAAWTALGSNTVSDDAGEIKITFVDNANGASFSLYQSGALIANTVPGKTYIFSAMARVNAGTSIVVSEVGGSNANQTITSTSLVPLRLVITATQTGHTIRTTSMGAGEIIWISNVSVKEVAELVADLDLSSNTLYDIGLSLKAGAWAMSVDQADVATLTDAGIVTPVWSTNVTVGASTTSTEVLNGTISVIRSSNNAGSTWYSTAAIIEMPNLNNIIYLADRKRAIQPKDYLRRAA